MCEFCKKIYTEKQIDLLYKNPYSTIYNVIARGRNAFYLWGRNGGYIMPISYCPKCGRQLTGDENNESNSKTNWNR